MPFIITHPHATGPSPSCVDYVASEPGEIYVAAGHTGASPTRTEQTVNEEFNQAGDSWTTRTALIAPARTGANGCHFDGKGYITAGLTDIDGTAYTSAISDHDEYAFPGTDSWTARTSALEAVVFLETQSQTDGLKYYRHGGRNSATTKQNDYDYYQSDDSWTNQANTGDTKWNFSSCSLSSNDVLTFWGLGGASGSDGNQTPVQFNGDTAATTVMASKPVPALRLGIWIEQGCDVDIGKANHLLGLDLTLPTANRLLDNDEFDRGVGGGGAWTSKTDYGGPARNVPAGARANGKLVFCCGSTGGASTTDNDEYDPGLDSYTAKTAITTGRNRASEFNN